MTGDPLSDVVRALKLSGGVFLEGTLTAPWAIRSKVTEEDCKPFLPLPSQLIAYHVVTEGEMLVIPDDGAEHVARAGDVVFLPSNAWHTLASERGLPPAVGDDLVLPPSGNGLATIRFGGGGQITRILCGFIASESAGSSLLSTLPETLVIRIEDFATLTWLEASIAIAARELTAGRVSSGAIMGQLAELMLVEALRAHLEAEKRPKGWLAGMADPAIARALALIHRSIGDPPGLEMLAREGGLSRSVFIERFTRLVGMSPGRYVSSQRMALAQGLLRDTTLTTAEIAYRAGYDAPEAFSRAFKRETGLAPADWRVEQSREPDDQTAI